MSTTKPITVSLVVCLAVVALVRPAHATLVTLTFDDLEAAKGNHYYDNCHYGDTQWSGFDVRDYGSYAMPFPATHHAVEADYWAYAADNTVFATVTFDSPAWFYGAYFGCPSPYQEWFELYDGVNGDHPLGVSGKVSHVSGLPQWLDAGGAVVTKVVIRSDCDGWTVVDDFQYELTGGPSSVPEPCSMALLGLAAGGVGAMVRRRRRA